MLQDAETGRKEKKGTLHQFHLLDDGVVQAVPSLSSLVSGSSLFSDYYLCGVAHIHPVSTWGSLVSSSLPVCGLAALNSPLGVNESVL